jgi:hypothetical protein
MGQNNTGENQTNISETNEQDTSFCEPYETTESMEDRTEYILSKYRETYDSLTRGQDEIGIVITPNGGLAAERESGADANVPNGLVISESQDGEVIATLVEQSGSALKKMRNNFFYDAIEQFRSAQSTLSNIINNENSTTGWGHIIKYLNDCGVNESERIKREAQRGKNQTEYFFEAAKLFEQQCQVYLDNEAPFGSGVQEAEKLQEEALSKLQQGIYPKSPEQLENEVTVYTPDD